jgi:hypothetical protein
MTGLFECDDLIVPLSPSQLTNTLHIKNFARPFTIQNLQTMLLEYGTIVSFWMDPIKTHCFVTYESTLAASEALNNLHNKVWPSVMGRPLIAEPISQERSQELIHIEISEGISDPTQHDHDSLSKPSATPFEPVGTNSQKFRRTFHENHNKAITVLFTLDSAANRRTKNHIMIESYENIRYN